MIFVNLDTAKARFSICKNCEKFNSLVKVCSVCNCFMPAKVMLGFKSCPLQKWGKGTETKPEADYTHKDFE